MSDFEGWIVEESLEEKSANNTKGLVSILKTHDVTNTEKGYPKEWCIHHVIAKRENIHNVTEALRLGLKEKWYAHFVDEGHMLIIVFRRRVFFLDRLNPKSWEKAFEYGRKWGVNPKFFEGMPVKYSLAKAQE